MRNIGRATRLPDLPNAPTRDNLLSVMQAAQAADNRPVTVKWVTVIAGDELMYWLQAFCTGPQQERLLTSHADGAARGEPQWTLIQGPAPEWGKTIWNCTSRDLELVYNLISGELDGAARKRGSSISEVSAKQNTPAPPLDLPWSQPVLGNQQFPPTPQPPEPSTAGVKLAGNLKEIELPNVLQSVVLCKMTGGLQVTNQLREVNLFFEDGNLTHATAEGALSGGQDEEISGDNAVLDLITWDSGVFNFDKQKRSNKKTVQRRLESLLMEGSMLRDYSQFLAGQGIDADARIKKANPALTEKEFEEIVQQGLPLDMSVQKRIYLLAKETPLRDIVTSLSLPRTSWLPFLFNLVSQGLLSCLSEKAQAEAPAKKPNMLDENVINAAARELLRSETGMLSYPLFLHFLKLESIRHQQTGSPAAIIMFESRIKRQTGLEPLSNAALRLISETIEETKSPLDLLGQYEPLDFILLLPLKTLPEARELAAEIVEKLPAMQLPGLENSQDLIVRTSVAAMPDDGDNPEALLSAIIERRHDRQATPSVQP